MLTVFTPSQSIHKAKTHFGVFLALFCVFLIYFGPLYSQLADTLQDRVATATEHSHSAQHHPVSTKPSTDHKSPPQSVSANTMEHHGHHNQIEGRTNLLEACGYCSLLFHLSWLKAQTFTIVPLEKEPYPSIIYATLVRKYLAIFTPLIPRAPPRHSRFTAL